jgi:hypothetical protein
MVKEEILAPLTEANGEWVWRSRMAGALDTLVAGLEREWGFDRLPRLVSPETRERFVSAQDMHRQATMAGEDMAELDAMMMRAWRALEAEARAGGYEPLPGPLLTVQADEAERGTICICQDDTHAQAVLARAKAEGWNAEAWTVEEVGRVLKGASPIAEIKAAFPKAKVVRKGQLIEDEIPI